MTLEEVYSRLLGALHSTVTPFAFIGAIDDARDDPHRTQQDEDRRSCRGQRQGGGDPGPEPQMEVSGEGVSCGAGHPVKIPKRH